MWASLFHFYFNNMLRHYKKGNGLWVLAILIFESTGMQTCHVMPPLKTDKAEMFVKTEDNSKIYNANPSQPNPHHPIMHALLPDLTTYQITTSTSQQSTKSNTPI
ncbi:hypothetical protein EV426DRAFT_609058, partial [Tirmania nivea]